VLSPSQWWLVREPVDLRAGIDRLLALTVSMLGHDVRQGGAYVFRNRAGSRIKVLCLDGQGVWLCAGVNWQRLSTRLSALPEL